MSIVDIFALLIAIIGLFAALIARRTWLLVEGDLSESWKWILPSVPVYAISFLILVIYNFMQRFEVAEPVFQLFWNVRLDSMQSAFSMKVWEPIIQVLKNVQALAELVFLVLVLIGLIRQYKLFQELYDRQG